ATLSPQPISSLFPYTTLFRSTDDIEDALQQRFDPSISLDTKKETKAADEDLKNYILQKINIKVNGKSVKLDYIGKEYDTDMVMRSEEHTSELQSRENLVCRLL